MISTIFKKAGYIYQLEKRNFHAHLRPTIVPNSCAISKNSIHWVGHSTVIINIDNILILTDPVTSRNLGFVKRLVKPSYRLKDLQFNYILISHAHMDHFDLKTLITLNRNAIIIAPKNLKIILKLLGFKQIFSISDGEEYCDCKIKIKSLKANHDGRRYYLGKYDNSNSYIIEANKHKILFVGDTAYTEIYNNLHADVVLMPVGCYLPKEFEAMHCNPIQGFKMFKMSGSKYMLPIHYKTYILAQDEDKLTEQLLNNINDGSIKLIDIGDTFSLNN